MRSLLDEDEEIIDDNDKGCLGCHASIQAVKTDVSESYHDFASALYEVSTAWMRRE